MKHNKNVVIAIIFLASVCIVISSVQTYKGWFEAVNRQPLMALGITAVITVGLIVFNYLLYEDVFKNNGKSKFILLSIYLLFAMFSFVANLNAFYSQYNERDILTDDLMSLDTDLTSLQGDIRNAVEESVGIGEFLKDVNNLSDVLLAQIHDEELPRVGRRAKIIIEQIEDKLETPLTLPYGNADQQANSLKSQIDAIVTNIIEQKTKISKSIVNEAEVELGSLKIELDSVQLTNTLDDDKMIKSRIIEAYNRHGELVSNYIDDNSIFEFERIEDSNENLGKISHTLSSIRKSEYRNAGVLMILLSLLIDIITPGAIFVLGRRKSSGGFPVRKSMAKKVIK